MHMYVSRPLLPAPNPKVGVELAGEVRRGPHRGLVPPLSPYTLEGPLLPSDTTLCKVAPVILHGVASPVMERVSDLYPCPLYITIHPQT